MIQRNECGCGFSVVTGNTQTNKHSTFKHTFPRIVITATGVSTNPPYSLILQQLTNEQRRLRCSHTYKNDLHRCFYRVWSLNDGGGGVHWKSLEMMQFKPHYKYTIYSKGKYHN